ncbi:MAG: SAP domain-containing protein [Planctomycetota bacterium]
MVAVKVSTKPMKMPEIRKKAQSLGITPGKIKKNELIHAIQEAEGCTPCFGRSNGQCQYSDCCFMIDCLKIRI